VAFPLKVALVAAGAAMLGLLLTVGQWLTLWADEWDFIVGREDLTARALLAPFTETLVALPVVVY
jgi:hypothetical protein